jgi:hypothetical protein
MTVFPTAGHLCSWARQAPQVSQSAGKRKGKNATGRGNPYIGAALGEAAIGAGRTQTFLGAKYRRLVRHMPKKKAQGAIMRTQLVICHTLLSDPGAEYEDLGTDYYERKANIRRRARDHIRGLECLGYKVTIEALSPDPETGELPIGKASRGRPCQLSGQLLAGLSLQAVRVPRARPVSGRRAHVAAQPMEQGRGHQRHRGDRDRSREAEQLGRQLSQGRGDSADQDRGGRAGHGPLNHVAGLRAHAGQAGEPCRLRGVPDDDGSHVASLVTRCAQPARRPGPARPVHLADQLPMISEEADTPAGRAAAPCGRGWASDGAAQAIITTATATMTRPTTPTSHVAFACSLLTTAVISPPRLRSHAHRDARCAAGPA